MRLLVVLGFLCSLFVLSRGCTNYLISAGASADGSTMITYAADSHVLYGFLAHYKAADHPAGSYREIYDWDTGAFLGKIPEVNHTYNVIGNMNEFQLSIGETTYGGLPDLCHQKGAIVDYGSLIYITLQRAKTAREAITTMGKLVATYGYASEGESFSIADPTEVWIMEIIGKGDGETGAVWVARKVPDGYICAHANQARIQTFPLDDPENCIYSPDVVDFAKKKGLYPESGRPEDFSFSDIYDPVNFEGARFCEIRVWSFFRKVAPGMDEYFEYVKGADLTKRMPLWVQPTVKISVNDTMNYMRDHFEDTWFDFRFDVGADSFEMPYRWRPLTWTVDGQEYLNERSVGTQQTGFSFVAQMRSWIPDGIGGIIWFGVDDTASSVYVPMYSGMTRVPKSWAEGNGDMMTFTFDSAFWVFNMVTNFEYPRYCQMHPEVFAKIVSYENQYFAQVPEVDAKAKELYKDDPAKAIELVTSYSEEMGTEIVKDWLVFWQHLFTKYMDGNVKFVDPLHRNPIVQWPGYPAPQYSRIVKETGDHYKVLSSEPEGKLRFV